MSELTAREIAQLDDLDIHTLKMKFGTIVAGLMTYQGTPINAVKASDILTVSGVVIAGQTLTIDNPKFVLTDVYEFLADAAQAKTVATNIAVDITASVTNSSGTLTIDTQPTIGNTMVVDGKVFTFVADGNEGAEGSISIGTDLASAQANIVAAINGTDTINTPHASVSAATFGGNASVITALVGGVAGDAIATTESFTAGTNVFAAATLGSGADCSAANAIVALALAITTSDTQGVDAVDGAGDTIDFTAEAGGVAGNSITLAETMVNGALTTVTLEGGIDGTVGSMNSSMIDATHIYRATADNTKADANWRKIAHSAL